MLQIGEDGPHRSLKLHCVSWTRQRFSLGKPHNLVYLRGRRRQASMTFTSEPQALSHVWKLGGAATLAHQILATANIGIHCIGAACA